MKKSGNLWRNFDDAPWWRIVESKIGELRNFPNSTEYEFWWDVDWLYDMYDLSGSWIQMDVRRSSRCLRFYQITCHSTRFFLKNILLALQSGRDNRPFSIQWIVHSHRYPSVSYWITPQCSPWCALRLLIVGTLSLGCCIHVAWQVKNSQSMGMFCRFAKYLKVLVY